MRRRLIAAGKIALIVGLMSWVATTIQWRDTWTVVDAAGQTQQVLQGRIIGPWDGSVVSMEMLDLSELREFIPGPQPGGGHGEISPGIITYVRQMDLLFFLLATLCYLISVSVAATRWWWLLRVNDLPVSLLEAQRFTWVGIFFNNIVPGQTGGDLIKALYIMKHCPDGRVPALMSVIVDRILGLAALAMLGAAVVLFNLNEFLMFAIGIWSVLLAVILGGVVAFSRRVRKLIRLDILIARLPTRLSGLLYRVDQAVFFYRAHKRGIAGWLLIGCANHVVSVVGVVLVGEALGVGMPITTYFVLVPVINIISAVPIAPNAWGVGEALYGKLFEMSAPDGIAAKVMRTRAVALSVVYRIMLTMVSLLGGLVLLTEREKVTREDVRRELAREGEEGQIEAAK